MEDHQCFFLGAVHGVTVIQNSQHPNSDQSVNVRSSEVQVVDRIENAQIDGRLASVAVESSKVVLHFDEHGVRITDAQTKEVLDRLPLCSIAQALHYNDGTGRWNVVIKSGQVGKNMFSCFVFQVTSEIAAQKICHSLESVFDNVIQQT